MVQQYDFIIPMTTMRKTLKENIQDITFHCQETISGNKVELVFTKKGKICSSYIKVNDNYIYTHPNNKNKNKTVFVLYEQYKKLNFIQDKEREEQSSKEYLQNKIDEVYKECEDEFRELLGENLNIEKEGFQKISEGELKRYIERILEKDPEELENLRELNKRIKAYEQNLLESETIPTELLELAVKAKGTIPKLEKVLVTKARRLVLSHKIHYKKEDHLQEFFNRFFDPEDTTLAQRNKVPEEKNFMRLARIEVWKLNKGHKGHLAYSPLLERNEYIATQPGILETRLGLDYNDLMWMVYQEMIENVYLFDGSLGIKLDTYVFQTIKNAIQKLRNLMIKRDSKGAIREQGWKETKVVGKLQKIKSILDEKSKVYNLENILEEIESNPEEYKNIWEKEVKQFMNFSSDNYIEFEKMESQGDGEFDNQTLLYDLWEEKQKDTEIDPRGFYIKEETNKQFEKMLHSLTHTEAEKLVLEFLLEKLLDNTTNLKVDQKEFNHYYADKLNFERLSQKEIDDILQELIFRISNNRNEFRLLTGIDF